MSFQSFGAFRFVDVVFEFHKFTLEDFTLLFLLLSSPNYVRLLVNFMEILFVLLLDQLK